MKTNVAPAAVSPRHVVLLCLMLLVARTYGQTTSSSLDGILVRCGTEQVAVVEGTASKAGCLAAGWTLRPKADKLPINWSTYNRKDPAAFVAKFNPEGTVDFPDDGDYQLFHLMPLVILHGVHTSQALLPGQLEEFALLALRTHNEFLGITLAIFSFALFIDGYLVYVSTFVPKVIGVLLVIASVCYLLNSVANIMDLPLGPLDGLILIPSFLGELSFCLWLLVRGVDEPRWQAMYAASSAQGP